MKAAKLLFLRLCWAAVFGLPRRRKNPQLGFGGAASGPFNCVNAGEVAAAGDVEERRGQGGKDLEPPIRVGRFRAYSGPMMRRTITHRDPVRRPGWPTVCYSTNDRFSIALVSSSGSPHAVAVSRFDY
jgi:hypothetical protein